MLRQRPEPWCVPSGELVRRHRIEAGLDYYWAVFPPLANLGHRGIVDRRPSGALAVSADGPALPRLQEPPLCLLAARPPRACKHAWLSYAWASSHTRRRPPRCWAGRQAQLIGADLARHDQTARFRPPLARQSVTPRRPRSQGRSWRPALTIHPATVDACSSGPSCVQWAAAGGHRRHASLGARVDLAGGRSSSSSAGCPGGGRIRFSEVGDDGDSIRGWKRNRGSRGCCGGVHDDHGRLGRCSGLPGSTALRSAHRGLALARDHGK
jgi:hypothetical protein